MKRKRIVIAPKDASRVGFLLKAIREQNNLEQKRIFVKMKGKNQSHLSRIETGKKVPSFPTIVSYLKAAGYSVHFVPKKK